MVARLRARLAQEDGMTLVELLTTMAILGLVMTAIIGMFVSGLHAEIDMNDRFQAQQDARLALTSMRQDVRTACATPSVYTSASGSPVAVAAGTAGDTVVLGFCDASDGTWNTSAVRSVTWCTRDEGGGQYALYRETDSSDANGDPACATGTTGVKEADSLTTNSVFTYLDPSGARPELELSFPVDADLSKTGGLYTLSDTIMLRNAPPPSFTLSVSKTGTGSGAVSSSPAGIDCGATCSSDYTSTTQVTLSATPASGSTFAGWSGGGCSGTGTCTVTMSAAESVSATFNVSS